MSGFLPKAIIFTKYIVYKKTRIYHQILSCDWWSYHGTDEDITTLSSVELLWSAPLCICKNIVYFTWQVPNNFITLQRCHGKSVNRSVNEMVRVSVPGISYASRETAVTNSLMMWYQATITWRFQIPTTNGSELEISRVSVIVHCSYLINILLRLTQQTWVIALDVLLFRPAYLDNINEYIAHALVIIKRFGTNFHVKAARHCPLVMRNWK